MPEDRQNEESKKRKILFYGSFVSWILGAIVLILFFIAISECGLCEFVAPPYIFYLLLLLGVVLFLFPFVKNFRIGNLISLEKDIQETRRGLDDLKNEVRNYFLTISNSISSANSRASANLNVNLPPPQERNLAIDAGRTYVVNNPSIVRESEKLELSYPLREDEDYVTALAKTRIRIEFLLRKIMGKRLKGKDLQNARFMSLLKLSRLFVKQHDAYDNLEPTFDYVIKVCNAAIHAQPISPDQALEVLKLGSYLIATLEKLAKKLDMPID